MYPPVRVPSILGSQVPLLQGTWIFLCKRNLINFHCNYTKQSFPTSKET